ncbi:hypothetical protein AWQ21_13230 [Picosynechococcus sp. PCC 7003]|uniref:hypothetical protein n=1 Tax=Picosynechococcus sp. PCC 7003 TaxID=374981 RepID=UPI000810CCBD|nr:hypothetical protein [Picosynechococcus sp. PCC 7003]ANV85249.1 hypothetical protein AWQ21_13230 [Picosynechococcus sp. PCC 7003]
MRNSIADKLMKKPALLTLICGFSVAIASVPAAPSQAQTANDLEGNYQQSENSSLYGNTDGFNPYDLIHMMRLGNKDPEQFRESTNSNLNNAAADYRSRLQEYWRQKKQAETSAANGTPEDGSIITPTETFE